MADYELSVYVLQLVQVLKYEARHDSSLARFLLRRSLRCPHLVGHTFFWCLKAEMHVPEVSERFGLLLQEYLRCCGPHRDELMLQNTVEDLLKDMGEFVKKVRCAPGHASTRTRRARLHTRAEHAWTHANTTTPRPPARACNRSRRISARRSCRRSCAR